jgi:hemerythrin
MEDRSMPLIQWNDTLSVGISESDTQHKKLIDMINNLNDAMKQGKGNAVIGQIVMGLVAYTKTHFGMEEKIFDQYQYPDTAAHKREHAAFVQKLEKFKTDFETNKIGLSLDLMTFLSQWLQNHIKGTDKKYTAFFKQHGVN